MRKGRMTESVVFERQTATTDEYGNVTDGTWTTIASVRGALMTNRMNETQDAGRLEATATGDLIVRRTSTLDGVTEADRAVINSVPYQIRGKKVTHGRDRYLRFEVERGVA